MEEGLIYKNSVLQKLTFADYYHQCYNKGFACALYRLPQSDEAHMIIDLSGGQNLEKVEIEQQPGGFVFHPFSSEKHPIKYLLQDIHIVNIKAGDSTSIIHSSVGEEKMAQLFETEWSNQNFSQYKVKRNEPETSEKEKYMALISKTINQIDQNNKIKQINQSNQII